MDEKDIPILDVIERQSLPTDWRAKVVIAMIKCTDDEGDISWQSRIFGEDIAEEEAIGALTVQTEMMKREALRGWELEE